MNAKNEKGDPTRSEATRSSATRSTRFEVDVEAPAEHVWKAFTEAEELVRWFPLQAEVTPGEGGSVLWAWGGAWDWRHRVDAWEAPRLLRLVQDLPQRFDADGKPITDTSAGAPMAIEVTLTSSGGTTRVTLVHSGFGEGAAWDDEIESTSTGWAYELTMLKHYLEGHRGKERRAGWAMASTELTQAEVWERLLSPEAFLLEAPNRAPGEPFAVTTAGGPRLSGRLHTVVPERELSGHVNGLDGGVLRLSTHRVVGRTGVLLWLSSYSEEGEVDGFGRRARAVLDRLFPRDGQSVAA